MGPGDDALASGLPAALTSFYQGLQRSIRHRGTSLHLDGALPSCSLAPLDIRLGAHVKGLLVTDYGHDLLFGAFLTPGAREVQAAVRAAQAAEQAGLDLLALQDHPYNPAFLDTVALMGHLAARTRRITLAGDVLNLPLRPPAVLAKTIATLDLLNEGRIELGLGAGGFWDAIEAFGGRRLTPGQSVAALSEAIDVIRALWDVHERSMVRVEGEHHHVVGAKRGPAPAHPVSLWIGGYRPRMLRLIGAKADGWWPSLGMLPLADVPAASRQLDDAAQQAGRDPREIRRLVNVSGRLQAASSHGLLQGPPKQWVDQLTLLALEHGFSTFVVAGDDTADYDRIGQEIAPAVREAVARERAAAVTAADSSGIARAQVRLVAPGRGNSLRRPSPAHPEAPLASGVDYAALPDALRHKSLTPRDSGYDDVRSTFMAHGRPGLVVLAETVQDVQAAVGFAAAQPVPFSVRSGGHGVDGTSTNTGGVLLDVSALKDISVVDVPSRRFRVGPGATWSEVAAALAPHGWVMTSGNAGAVGVGGLGTNGGIGWLVRSQGWTVDHLLAAELVLPDGTTVRTDADHKPDLFWAVRGAGAHIGVVTALEFAAIELSDVVVASLSFDVGTTAQETARFLQEWSRTSLQAPRELTNFLNLSAHGPLVSAQTTIVWAGGDAQAALPHLQELAGLAPLVSQRAEVVGYPQLMAAAEVPHRGQQQMQVRNGFVDRLGADTAARLAALVTDPATLQVELRPVAGAISDRPATATAFGHRDAQLFVSLWGRPGAVTDVDRSWSALDEAITGSYAAYSNDSSSARWDRTYPGDIGQRLRRIAAVHDPTGLLRR